jgi:hypothetical protein
MVLAVPSEQSLFGELEELTPPASILKALGKDVGSAGKFNTGEKVVMAVEDILDEVNGDGDDDDEDDESMVLVMGTPHALDHPIHAKGRDAAEKKQAEKEQKKGGNSFWNTGGHGMDVFDGDPLDLDAVITFAEKAALPIRRSFKAVDPNSRWVESFEDEKFCASQDGICAMFLLNKDSPAMLAVVKEVGAIASFAERRRE